MLTETQPKHSPTSQGQQILKALNNGRVLTGLDIINRFDCLNYRARISELRSEGHAIETRMITTKSGKRIAQYYIKPTLKK